MSAARTRRRFLAHERGRRRHLLLGLPDRFMTKAHARLLNRINDARATRQGYAWIVPDPQLGARRMSPP
jgi:sugar lactone lactonase YvrE